MLAKTPVPVKSAHALALLYAAVLDRRLKIPLKHIGFSRTASKTSCFIAVKALIDSGLVAPIFLSSVHYQFYLTFPHCAS